MRRILDKNAVAEAISRANSRGYDPLFDNVDLSGLDLSGMDLRGARFICSNVDGTNFVGCLLQHTRWCLTDISKADISSALITTSIIEGKPTYEQLTDSYFREQFHYAMLKVKLGKVAQHADALRVQNIINQYNTFKAALPQCAYWIVP
jgi:uncharacterized protein YjbI with pentapeptide repeats